MTESSPEDLSRAALEAAIREACEASAYDQAVTQLVQGYGEELFSFLIARLRDRTHAEETFSLLVEDLWTGLPKFEFRSSVRTWSYVVARHAAARYARSPERRKDRNLTLSRNVNLSQVMEQVRTATHSYLRTDVKSKMRELREQLDPDDQTLLILRVDRGMSWRDLALVMAQLPQDDAVLDADPISLDLDAATIDREAARLRKRFERVKDELKRLAKAAGLLE